MSTSRFRAAAVTLIVFNLAGTVLTWLAHLSKPGTSNTHAILQGTEFTGPLVYVAVWIVVTALTLRSGRAVAIATVLMTLFAATYAIGDITELTKKNIGVSATKWHVIIALDVVGLVLALSVVVCGLLAVRASRQQQVQVEGRDS